MRTVRRAPAVLTTLTAVVALVALPGAGLAQDPVTTYTDGVAQLLVRVGAPSMTTFSLVSGVRDATLGTLTLEYRAVDGDATLRILTPNVAGTHAAAPKPPRGAAVIYRDVTGLSGARAACSVTWTDLTQSSISGSYLCPKERRPTGTKARYAVAGTFSARVVPDDGVVTDPAPMPIYPAGTPVEVNGQTLTVQAATDLASVCVIAKAKGADAGDCAAKQLPVAGTFRAVAISACVADEGAVLRLIDKTGASRSVFGGAPEAVLPIGLPVVVVDPGVTTRGLPRVVNPGTCLDGHLVAGTQGPLVIWTPPDGAPAVGWTLDETALAHTADAPDPAASGDPGASSPAPAASVAYATGFADGFLYGTDTGSQMELELIEGTWLSDGAGVSILHLMFAMENGTLVIDLPGREGFYTWAAGEATANQGVAVTLGDTSMDAGLTACEVDVAPTEAGGVQGSYACVPPWSGSASGSFVANP